VATLSTTTIGNHNRITEKLNTTGTIIPGELAYRFTFYGNKGDGLYPNINGTGNNSYLDNNRFDLRAQLLGIFGDTTDRLIVEHMASNEVNNYSANLYTELFTRYANGASRFTFSQIEPAIFGVNTPHNPYQENSIDNFPIRTQTDGAFISSPKGRVSCRRQAASFGLLELFRAAEYHLLGRSHHVERSRSLPM
jgi:hypothetical protein